MRTIHCESAMVQGPLKSHIRDWREMAAVDPFRAITGRKKIGSMEELYATAGPPMEQLFAFASSAGLPQAWERVLEFGCGAGRFLPHFEKRFREVWGVDVSPEMLELARRHNPACRFHLNAAPDLASFPDDHFDLVYSFLVLQHLPRASTITSYVAEFMRIVKPAGLVAFQVPDRLTLRWRVQPRRRAYRLLHAVGIGHERLQSWNLLPMRLTAVPESVIRKTVTAAGGKILRIEPLGGVEQAMYYCSK